MYGYVYKIIFPNGDTYIGSHHCEFFDESYWGSSINYKYWQALFFTGKENVKREIVCWCKTKKDLLKKEYETMLEHDGYLYNLSIPKEKTNVKIKQCIVCGESFECDKRHPRQKYCSKRCASKACDLKITTKKAWNKGLTKENDERVLKYSETFKNKNYIPWNKGLKLKNRRKET